VANESSFIRKDDTKESSFIRKDDKDSTSCMIGKKRELEIVSLLDEDDDDNNQHDEEIVPEKLLVKDVFSGNSKESIYGKKIVRLPPNMATMDKTNEISRPKGLQELYKTPKEKEFVLKLIVVGHNPSHQSYTKGHYYANPVNRMWPLLRKAEIVPSHYSCHNDQDCPKQLSLGFTDVCWNYCETDSFNISDKDLHLYKDSFYKRLLAHVSRVQMDFPQLSEDDCYPRILAFSGVRQWKALFPMNHFIQKMNIGGLNKKKEADDGEENNMTKKARGTESVTLDGFFQFSNKSSITNMKVPSSIDYGVQSVKPPDWPKLLEKSIVFVLPSPSGAAALTNEQRENPYIELGQLFKTITLPSFSSSADENHDKNQIQIRETEVKERQSIELIDISED
jgi:G:T/U-mismatch repair DNA glycosylase